MMKDSDLRALFWPCVAITTAMVFGLWLEKRLWVCGCGNWSPWITDVNSRHCSQHFLDPYSLTHFLHGFMFWPGLWWARTKLSYRTQFLICFALEAVWELWENTPFVIQRYRTATMALGYVGDSIVNSVGDLLSCGLGIWVVARVPWKVSLAIFLVIELGLIVTIRDSLMLNILMLLWPIPAILNWQMQSVPI